MVWARSVDSLVAVAPVLGGEKEGIWTGKVVSGLRQSVVSSDGQVSLVSVRPFSLAVLVERAGALSPRTSSLASRGCGGSVLGVALKC